MSCWRADGNSYLVAAAVLGAALLGIEEEIDPGEPLVGNAYEVEDDLPADRKFPTQTEGVCRSFDSLYRQDGFLGMIC
ncbi:MAG: hypothetical protein Ct9H90mP27_2180 [Gammaproteobacteria bacterium]|nr:MAG: hypothetical protein Ct9H90mP27_2180 [Gammaproteobacteria bacterium]